MTQQTVAHATNGHLTHHVAERVYIRSLFLVTLSQITKPYMVRKAKEQNLWNHIGFSSLRRSAKEQ